MDVKTYTIGEDLTEQRRNYLSALLLDTICASYIKNVLSFVR